MTTVMKGRPTLYKGIQMRSRLEADYAAHLDQSSQPWQYEPTCFAADGVQWLPDFRVTWDTKVKRINWYHEVKPISLMDGAQTWDAFAELADKILRQMSVAWESEPDARLKLAFHRYGQPRPDFYIVGTPNRPWGCVDCLTSNSMWLIWPGMGQMDALPSAPESAREGMAAHAR